MLLSNLILKIVNAFFLITANDVIVTPHFEVRLEGRALNITSHILKYLDQENTKITYAKGHNRFMLRYYCEPVNKILTLIIHIQDNSQVVLITIY